MFEVKSETVEADVVEGDEGEASTHGVAEEETAAGGGGEELQSDAESETISAIARYVTKSGKTTKPSEKSESDVDMAKEDDIGSVSPRSLVVDEGEKTDMDTEMRKDGGEQSIVESSISSRMLTLADLSVCFFIYVFVVFRLLYSYFAFFRFPIIPWCTTIGRLMTVSTRTGVPSPLGRFLVSGLMCQRYVFKLYVSLFNIYYLCNICYFHTSI